MESAVIGGSVGTVGSGANAAQVPTGDATLAALAPLAPATPDATAKDGTPFIHKLFAGTICLVFLMVSVTLCHRVWVDGNAPQTTAITEAIVSTFPWLAGLLAASVVGVKAVPAVAAALLTGGGK